MESINFMQDITMPQLQGTITTTCDMGITTEGTTNTSQWCNPELLETNVYPDHIDQIFKETSRLAYTVWDNKPLPEQRIFKIIYSCKDGKWNVSDRIYGKIILPKNETYEF